VEAAESDKCFPKIRMTQRIESNMRIGLISRNFHWRSANDTTLRIC